jgi:hypothetical protein
VVRGHIIARRVDVGAQGKELVDEVEKAARRHHVQRGQATLPKDGGATFAAMKGV